MKDLHFSRLFAMTPYKSLTLSLAEMSLSKDFIGIQTGDPYPLSAGSDAPKERVAHGEYALLSGTAVRFFTRFSPFATYEISALPEDGGEAGLLFRLPTADARISLSERGIRFLAGDECRLLPYPDGYDPASLWLITARKGAFDLYIRRAEKTEFFATLSAPAFAAAHKASVSAKSGVFLFASHAARVRALRAYFDSGVSLADLRPVRYTTGEVLTEGGRVFLTASVRMEEEAYQAVFSLIPGTAELSLTGVIFFDSGDGFAENDVAASLLYDKEKEEWLLWVCSFSHGHVLGHAAFAGDVRFGVSTVDITLMEEAGEADDRRLFLGFFGDEDPDLIYDKENGRWLFAVCRLVPDEGYCYHFFESNDPFSSFRFLGRGRAGDETGGSFVRIDGELAFVCGARFTASSEYRAYTHEGMRLLSFDYPDGGFRGWGTVIPIPQGTRTREYLITFDRHGGSGYRWSYGTLYCFVRE